MSNTSVGPEEARVRVVGLPRRPEGLQGGWEKDGLLMVHVHVSPYTCTCMYMYI